MPDQIIKCFAEEFDRFFSMLEKQIDICPDDLWSRQAGGYIFWQLLLHTLARTLIYARPNEAPFAGLPHKP